jgi:hypothetical protein
MGLPSVSMAAFHYFDPNKPSEIPALLSQTGFYSSIATKTIDTAAKAFTVNSALWSDGTVKRRWVVLPPGKKIQWVDETDLFNYPDSTVFVKTFLQVRAPGDTAYWETRLLVKKANPGESTQNWFGFSYRWNTAQTDANLVDVDNGANAVLAIKDAQGKGDYRKWRFPSQTDCNLCHQVISGQLSLQTNAIKQSRAVLGFFPAQLKKPTKNGTSDQVLDLFTAGVFSGTQPTPGVLARRFIGISEPIDAALTVDQKKAVLDNKARSYLASNCSGCHGDRAKEIGTTAARNPPNFDYFDLRQHDVAFNQIPAMVQLNDTTAYTDSTSAITGRNKYKWLVKSWGMNTDPSWSLSLPPGNPDTMSTSLIYSHPATQKGYPALSYLLYRLWARSTSAADSASWYQGLKMAAGFGDAGAQAKLGWLFSKPWGSQDWLNNLTTHNFTLDSIMAGLDNRDLYRNDGDGMPPLATYIPDTAALKVLGEWSTQQGTITGIQSQKAYRSPMPWIQNRVLVVPEGVTGEATFTDLRGRTFALQPIGPGRFAIPESAREGVYFVRIGKRYFKASFFR